MRGGSAHGGGASLSCPVPASVYLRHLEMIDFRNYAQLAQELPAGVAVPHGRNGAAKTDLLGGICVCGSGDCPRTRTSEDIVRPGCRDGFVRSDRVRSERSTGIEVGLVSTGQRQTKIDGVAGRRADLIGVAPAPLLWAEDIEMVRGEPSGRQRLLDRELSAVRRTYYCHLSRYRRTLDHRKKVLKAVRERRSAGEAPLPWEKAASRHGVRVVVERVHLLACV